MFLLEGGGGFKNAPVLKRRTYECFCSRCVESLRFICVLNLALNWGRRVLVQPGWKERQSLRVA
eukprot:5876228-Amphidinium_carterae.1